MGLFLVGFITGLKKTLQFYGNPSLKTCPLAVKNFLCARSLAGL